MQQTDISLKKLPPHDPNAEMSVLGSIFLENKSIEKILNTINPNDFYSGKNRTIFTTMLEMIENKTAIDLVTISQALKAKKKLTSIGGPPYLMDLMEATPTATTITHHAGIVREKANLRAIIAITNQAQSSAYEESKESEELASNLFRDIEEHFDSNRKATSLAEKVKEFALSTTGNFLSTEVYNRLQLSTRNDKKNISIILSRLKDEGLIEKYGNKNGHWRKVEGDCLPLNWVNVEAKELDIKYPLGIERYVRTFPKNIIIIAGSPDSGKTALLLNFIKLNMNKHKINYFSSEMGNMDLRGRLEEFTDVDITGGWKFSAWERSDKFADIIKPDEINVIDFLEITDNFWMIGGMIADIWKKLNTGIAVIAMQKDKKQEYGRGGMFSLEKPRLYVTLDPSPPGTIATIRKGKNWRIKDINPNGLNCKFNLYGGANITMTKEWGRDFR